MDLTKFPNKISSLLDNPLKVAQNAIQSYFIQPSAGSDDSIIGGVKLDIVGEQSLKMSNDVTDNYVESNVAYQDQISVKPMVYTIRGEVGELTYYQKNSANTFIGFLNQKLTPIVSFLPSVSKKSYKLVDKALKVSGWIDSADNAISKLQKLAFLNNEQSNLTSQQKAYIALVTLRNNRAPIDLTTPWTDLKSYVITDITLTQPSETREKTIINITFKEFRTVELNFTQFNAKQYETRLNEQKASIEKAGRDNGESSSLAQKSYDKDKSTVKNTADLAKKQGALPEGMTDKEADYEYFKSTGEIPNENYYIDEQGNMQERYDG